MSNLLSIRDANEDDVFLIREIAHKVWPQTYSSILPGGQVDYMLELIYSIRSLKNQIQHLGHHFFILEQEGRAVGFASYSEIEPRNYRLNKLYVLPELQGKGAGKMLLDKVIKIISSLHAQTLSLTVNRHNLNAKYFYERQGFTVSREEKTDIGSGYFMDDYIMEMGLGD